MDHGVSQLAATEDRGFEVAGAGNSIENGFACG
jgi:hypothetical protein